MTNPNPFALENLPAQPDPQQPQQPEDGGNPFALSSIERREGGQRRVLLRDAVRQSPDDAAEVVRLRRRYGTPDEVLLRNLRDVKMQAAVDDADALLQTSPRLKQALMDASRMRQAHDDLPALAQIESGFAVTAVAGAAQATLGVSEAIWRTPEAARRVVLYGAGLLERLGVPWQANPVRGLADAIGLVSHAKLPGGPQDRGYKFAAGTSDVANAVSDASGQLAQDEATFGPAFADLQRLSKNADLALTHALKGNGQPLADVLTDPRAWAAFVAQAAPSLAIAAKSGGSLPVIAWLEGMETASSAADLERRTGQKVSDAEFTQALVQTATVNALLERYGLDKVLGAQGKGLSGVLKAMVAEGGTEALQQLNSNLAEALSFNAAKPITEGVLASTMGGAGSGGGAAGARVGIDLVAMAVGRRAEEQALAQGEAARLAALLAAAEGSKLRSRSPETFREVVQQLAEQPDGTDAAVHVDAQVLNQLSGDVLNQLPAPVLQQLAAASQSGGSVAIPVADVLTLAPGTPLAEMLAEHGRVGDPAALSRAEAVAAQEAADTLLREDTQRVVGQALDEAQRQASRDAVRGQVLEQLQQAGTYRQAVNEGYADWVAAFYATMAERTGQTAEQLAAKYPLRVVAGLAQRSGALEQGDGAISDWRARWERRGLLLSVGERKDRIELSRIVVPEGQRGKGLGTEAMAELAALADQHGLHITLSPSADFGGNKKRLTTFYKRFGFVVNKGKNRAFTTLDSMYRAAPGKVLEQSPRLEPRVASTFAQARDAAKAFQGKPLTNAATGMVASVSRNNLDKMLSASAAGKSVSTQAHAQAVANVDQLFVVAELGETHADTRQTGHIAAVHRFFAPMAFGGQTLRVKLTVKEFPASAEGNRIYTVEALDVATPEKGNASETSDPAEQGGAGADASAGHPAGGGVGGTVPGQGLAQQARGTFSPDRLEIALSPQADLSTFFHETGHFFLEVMADLASQPDAPADVQADMAALLNWFGVESLEQWQSMTLDAQRPSHERFAEGIEQYLLEGKAPSSALQPLFRRFRAWMLSVYRSLQNFLNSKVGHQSGAVHIQLSDDVRRVFDRLLATEAEIAQAEEVAGLMPDAEATTAAQERLAARSMRDLKWARRATDEAVKRLQRDAEGLRREQRIEARRETMTQPLYRAWQFLTSKLEPADRLPPESKPGQALDPRHDSLLTAVAKLGGLARESAANILGVHPDDFKHPSGVFGRPVFRKTGGLDADAMGERLAELGYLLPKDDGRYELRDLEEAIAGELRGQPAYSIAKEYAQEIKAGEGLNLPALQAGRIEWASLLTPDVSEAQRQRLEQLGMTAKEGGIHLDLVAGLFGFASGQELAQQLAEATSPREAVEALTDQRMLEQHADLATPQAVQQAAIEAVHNEARARVLASELRTQQEMLGERRDTGERGAKGQRLTVSALAEAARQFGQQVVAGTPLRDLKSRAAQHRAAATRAARRWQQLTAQGDTAGAVQAKRDQLLNFEAARAAMEAMDAAKKMLGFFADVTRGGNKSTVEKGRDPDVVNAARAILAAYGVGSEGKRESALDYLERVREHNPELHDALAPSVAGAMAQAQPLEALSFEQLQALHEEVQSLWHLAQRSRQMEVGGDRMDLDDAAEQLADRMEAIGVPQERGRSHALTPADKARSKLQSLGSLLRRAEQWAEGMDGAWGGPFLRLVFQPVKAAADRYRADRARFTKAYEALLRDVEPHLKPGKIAAPELGYTFGYETLGHGELLHALLHTGNASNKRKLLLGRQWARLDDDGNLDTSAWDAFVSRMHAEGTLTEAHYRFAQGVWDLLESTKPLAQRTHRDVFGRYFDEVTADPVQTPWGEFRGGYVPALADPRLSVDADLRAMHNAEREGMQFAFPSTPKGFTQKRVEYNRPLLLDLRTVAQHLDKVLRFAHMEPAVRDVNKLLRHREVTRRLGRISPEVYQGMLVPWLTRSALQVVETPVVGDGGISRLATVLRRNAGMATMFGNLSNALQQLTGFTAAWAKLRADGLTSGMLRGAALYLQSPRKMAAQVAALSPYMAQRMDNEVSAAHGTMHEILLNPGVYQSAQQWALKHSYFLQSAVDNTMGPIIWSSAYNAALQKGHSEPDAVAYADGVIRQTQGSTLPEDVSRAETGSAWIRLFTQFTSFFNMMANTNATQLQQIAGSVGLRKGAGKALHLLLLGLFVPLWAAESIALAMRGGPEGEEDDGWLDDWIKAVFGLGTVKGLFAMLPGAGQIAMAGINRWTDNPADDRASLSPAVAALEGAAGVPYLGYQLMFTDDDINQRRAVRDVASLVAITTGIPVTLAARPLGYLAGVDQGRIEPTDGIDLARGLVTGVPSPESKAR